MRSPAVAARLPALLAALAASACGPRLPSPSPGLPEGPFPVRLSREPPAGDPFVVTLSAANTELVEATLPDGTPRTDRIETALTFEAEEHPAGDGARFVVRRFVSRRRGEESAVVEPGTVILAHFGGAFRDYQAEPGKPHLSEEAQRGLEMLINLDGRGDEEDRWFGSADPQRPGARWRFHKDAVAAELQRSFRFPEADLDGEVRLVSVREVSGVPCLHVEGRAVVEGADWVSGPPMGMNTRKMTVTLSHLSDCPVEPRRPCLVVDNRLALDATLEGELAIAKGTSSVRMHKEIVRSLRRTARP